MASGGDVSLNSGLEWIQVCVTRAIELNSPPVDLRSIWEETDGGWFDFISTDMEEDMIRGATSYFFFFYVRKHLYALRRRFLN